MPLLRGRNAPSAAEELRKQRKAFEEGDLRPAVRKKQEEAAESLRRRRSVRKGFHLKYQENLNKG